MSWINKFSVSSGTSSDWGSCHGVLSEDCSMQQNRRPQMPEGQSVTVFVAGINKSPDAAERMCDRPAIELTGIQYFDMWEGADPWMHRRARTHCLKRTRSEIQASGAGDRWRQTRDFCEAVGGWVWQHPASHQTVESQTIVRCFGKKHVAIASKERGTLVIVGSLWTWDLI